MNELLSSQFQEENVAEFESSKDTRFQKLILIVSTSKMERGAVIHTLSIRYHVSCDTINEILEAIKATTESDVINPEILQEVSLLRSLALVTTHLFHVQYLYKKTRLRYPRPSINYSG